MKQFLGLSNQDMEHLLITLDTSLKINTHAQFYLWAQGALQGFLPHEVLLCAHGDITRMRFKFETFTSVVQDPLVEKRISDPINGLMARTMDDWLRAGTQPRLFCEHSDSQMGRRQLLADMKRCHLGHVAVHGARGMQGGHGSFFVFARMPKAPGPREVYLLELLMPYLHTTLHRMMAYESIEATQELLSNDILLSKRGLQVLHWVKNGKTNAEIAQILQISPTTVKNHLQIVMRKLGVNNRAEAVGKSAALRLLAHGDPVT